MKAIAIAVCAALVATYAYGQTRSASEPVGRYQMQIARDGMNAWQTDTTNGAIRYCLPATADAMGNRISWSCRDWIR